MSKKKRMTEKEWMACGVSTPIWHETRLPMVAYLKGKASDRKLRLFACACCRRIWHLIPEHWWGAVQVAERYADGLATRDELEAEHRDSVPEDDNYEEGEPFYYDTGDETAAAEYAVHEVTDPDAYDAAGLVSEATADAMNAKYSGSGRPDVFAEELAAQAGLLRDIIGNPFRPATVERSWLEWNDGAVAKIARGIYDERTFHHLPVLADALEEAGCTDPDILGHCRQPGEHIRGCWVVDLLLGKE